MNTHPSKKIWIWISAVVIVGVAVYFASSSGAPASSGSALLSADHAGEAVGAQILSLLNQIQSLRIESSFFQNTAYKSLQDYTVAIPLQNVGRDNPFAPIPGFAPARAASH